MSILLYAFILSSFLQISWTETKSKQWGFKIEAPGQLLQRDTENNTVIGSIKSSLFYFQDESDMPDNYIYMVNCFVYPEGGMHSDSTDLLMEFFEASIDEAVNSIGGDLIYQSDYNYEEYPGRIWRIKYNQGTAMLRSVAYLVENHLYIIQTASLQEKAINSSANRFMDSFRLLD